VNYSFNENDEPFIVIHIEYNPFMHLSRAAFINLQKVTCNFHVWQDFCVGKTILDILVKV